MDTAIYFCSSCGLRMSGEESSAAVARGESHATVCCLKCAKSEQRNKYSAGPDPLDQEDDAEPAAQAIVPAAASRKPSGRTSAANARPSRTSGTAAKVTIKPADRQTSAPRSGKGNLILILGAVGVVFFLIVVVILSSQGNQPDTLTAAKSPQTAQTSTVVKSAPTVAPVVPETPLNKTLAPDTTPARTETPPDSQKLKTETTALNTTTAPANPYAVVEEFLHYKNFPRALERLATLEKELPGDDATRAKIDSLRTQCQTGSQALLEEMLKNADAKAKAGNTGAVRLALGPQRIQDLLPEQAAQAAKELPKYVTAAEAVIKEGHEKRAAEISARRADLEKDLPDKLGAPAKGTIIWAPGNAVAGLVWKEGKEELKQPAGKASYAELCKKISFEGPLGMVTNEPFLIEYSSTEACEIKVSFRLAEFGWRSGTIKAAAGILQTLEVNPNDDSKLPGGRRGKATGRAIQSIAIEPVNAKPGSLGIFRICR